MRKRPPTAEILATNLRLLMTHFDLSQAALGRSAGLAQTMLSGLLSREMGVKNPRSDSIDKLAAHFKIPAWKLLVPGMTIELLLSDDLHQLIEDFAKASDEGKRTIVRLAEAEVRYAATPSKPLFSKAAADGTA